MKRVLLEDLPAVVVCAAVVGFLASSLASAWATPPTLEAALGPLRRWYWTLRATPLTELLARGWVMLALVGILGLERLVPARRGQPTLSLGLRVDAVYTALFALVQVTVLPAYVDFLKALYQAHLSFLSLDVATDWPWLARLVVGYLVVDFLGWLHHVVRHRVPVFWAFHAVHHSQRELNMLSNERQHLVDYMVAQTVRAIPFFMLSAPSGLILGYLFFHAVHDRLNHANVRMSLGPLRYVFVTPQTHRVHHSLDPAHADTNFGVSLSIWDHLFGTQHRRYDEYPDTGVADPDFPHERRGRRLPVLRALVEQTVYPFRSLGRRVALPTGPWTARS